MSAPILPTAASITGKAIDGIVAALPDTAAHFNVDGRWNDLPKLWRAQVETNFVRIADEVKSARLRFAKGDQLRALCASEFDTVLPSDPQSALSQIALTRPAPGVGHAPAGIIPKGFRFVKEAAPAALPGVFPIAIPAATYTVRETVYVPQDQLTASVTVVAERPGTDGNVPFFNNYPPPTLLSPATPLFDPTFTVALSLAAGGSGGLDDPTLIAASKAYAVGQFGPTDGAIVAGILRQQSVRHYAAFPSGSLAYGRVYIADASWAWDQAWDNQVEQAFNSAWLGFGCRLFFGGVQNQQISVAANITVKNTDDLADTSSIDANVRTALRSYFDDRPDWYLFRNAAIQATIAAADPRILNCTSATVADAVSGLAIAEPANLYATVPLSFALHFYLTDNGVNATYSPPL